MEATSLDSSSHLGGSFQIAEGVTGSRIGLGTMTFGDQVGIDDAYDLVDIAIRSGVTMIDTANVYNSGRSESMLGQILKGRRAEIVLASKVGIPISREDRHPLSRDSIKRECEMSLRRLEVDNLDIYYLHQPDWGTDIEESLCTMKELLDSGVIRAVGVSNYAAWQIAEIQIVAREIGIAQVIIAQQQYNLLSRRLEEEYAHFVRSRGVKTVVYNPLAGGMLTGKHRGASSPLNTGRFSNPRYQKRYWNEAMFNAVDELHNKAIEIGVSLSQLAFRWLLSRDIVNGMLLGVSGREQLVENIAAISTEPLDTQTLELCDVIWKGLRGPAPAYNR